MPEYLLAIDQGTSSTKALLIDRQGATVAEASAPVTQQHPRPGWVEQQAEEIWESLRRAVRGCVPDERAGDVVGIALSVQRESTLAWVTDTAEPAGPVVSWQDQRNGEVITALEAAGHGEYVLDTTGLPLDPMFSAAKMAWLLDDLDPDRGRSRAGDLTLGTLDAWLLARLCGVRVTEAGSASRTQLLDVATGRWDERLLTLFGVPAQCLPEVSASTMDHPTTVTLDPLPRGVPVVAVLADSHAALFAHAGWRAGTVKATYGTGSSVMAVATPAGRDSGLCSTIAWRTDSITHAQEANIRSTGRTMTWLAELLDVDVDVVWREAVAASSDGVVLVPAFGGLGAPRWDRHATPVLTGFGLGTSRRAVARAALESIVHQVDDVLAAFEKSIGPLQRLLCDGGMTRSAELMQLQADLSDVTVGVPPGAGFSALGAGHLGGLVAGWWTQSDLEQRHDRAPRLDLHPSISSHERATARRRWEDAVRRTEVIR